MSKSQQTREERELQLHKDNAVALAEIKKQQAEAEHQARSAWPQFIPINITSLLVTNPKFYMPLPNTDNEPTTNAHIKPMMDLEDAIAQPLFIDAKGMENNGNLEGSYNKLKEALYKFTLSDNITRKWSKVALAHGTHLRLGKDSPVLVMAGKYHVLRKIFSYLTINKEDELIRALPSKVMSMMSEIQCKRGMAGHAYTMAQTLGSYDPGAQDFLSLMKSALMTDEGWIGFNPMLERKEDRTPTYNAIAGMSDNLESVVEMFKGNRCIACLFTTAGQFLPSPYKYAVMEQVRCQQIFTTFFDKYVICKPDQMDPDLLLTVSLVPITCGQWTESQSAQGLTFCLTKLYQYDMQGDIASPVKIEHFHMGIADGTGGTGSQLEQAPHGHPTKKALEFALKRIPQVLHRLKDKFGIFCGRVMFGQGLTDLASKKVRSKEKEDTCIEENWPLTKNYFWYSPDTIQPNIALIASPTTNASQMAGGMPRDWNFDHDGTGGGVPDITQMAAMLQALSGEEGGTEMLQQLLAGIGNANEGGAGQQETLANMMAMLGGQGGQEEGEGDPGCPTQ